MHDLYPLDYLFVEQPKTATSSISKLFDNINSLPLSKNELYVESGNIVITATHVSAQDLLRYFSKKSRSPLIVSSVRSPYDLVVSKYFYYSSGRIAKKVANPHKKVSFMIRIRVAFAQKLPFAVWLLFYPFKSQFYFVRSGNPFSIIYLTISYIFSSKVFARKAIVAEHLINFDELPDGLFSVLRKIGLDVSGSRLPSVNQSGSIVDSLSSLDRCILRAYCNIFLLHDVMLHRLVMRKYF